MSTQPRITHIDEVAPENMDKGDGWLITEFRLPFSERQGIATTMFHARFNPGSVHKKHRHANCEEIYYLVAGRGTAGAGGATEEVRAGHFHYVPADTEHWLVNADNDAPIEVIGWYLGASSVAATGYRYMGDVTEADRAGPHEGYTVGALAHIDDAQPTPIDATNSTSVGEFRIGLGKTQGIGHTAWRMVIDTTDGTLSRRHRADSFMFIVSGTGHIGYGEQSEAIQAKSVLHVPAGVEYTLEADDPLVVVGLFEDSGMVADGDD